MLFADRVFLNGKFRTMVDDRQVCQAVAVRDGRIVAAGTRDEVEEVCGSSTERIDCGGATGFPGFNDPHTHLLSTSKSRLFEISFDTDPVCRSIADVQDRIREKAAQQPPGTWILGSQVRDERYAERRYPTRWELDEAAPNHPVFIRGTGSHICCANSEALRLAGIDRDTEDPPGGSIDRDESGEPNGILRERGKLRLAQGKTDSVIPDYTFDQSVDALAAAAREVLLPSGITHYSTMIVDPDEIRAHQEVRRRGQFPVRTKLLLRVIEATLTLDDLDRAGIQNGFGDPFLSVGGVKMSIDGGSLQKNAALYDPYPGEPDNYGLIRIEQDELDETVARAYALGLRNVVHAIGERAYDMALDAFEKVFKGNPVDHRSRIEHLGNLPTTEEQIKRAKELGIIASPQPQFIHVYGDKWLDIFGEERLRGAFPFRTMLDAGLDVIGSSDYGMSPTNPLVGVQAAVTRRTESGHVLDADEAITVYEALKMYTRDAAWSDFDEDSRGTVEVGKRADLTLLSADPFETPAGDIASIPVAMTVVDGEVAHAADDAGA